VVVGMSEGVVDGGKGRVPGIEEMEGLG